MDNTMMKIAVIGCGAIARLRHIPELFENPDVAEIILCDVNYSNIEDLVIKYQIKQYFVGPNSWEDILKLNDVNGIIICTPNENHAKIAIESLKKGNNVLVEKPMAISIEEGQMMYDAAVNYGKLLLVAHHRRHQNCYKIGNDILQSGYLGNIHGILAQHKQPGPMEWAPNSKWFVSNLTEGGGVMFDLGIHMADIVSWYTKDEACESHGIITQKLTFFEQGRSISKMKSGIGVVIDVAWGVFEPEKRVTVYCEEGKLIVDEYSSNQVQIFRNSPKGTIANFLIPEHPNNSMNYPKFGVIDHFIKSIKGGDLERRRLNEHLNALKIVCESIRNIEIEEKS